jgi:hypothetical protein
MCIWKRVCDNKVEVTRSEYLWYEYQIEIRTRSELGFWMRVPENGTKT